MMEPIENLTIIFRDCERNKTRKSYFYYIYVEMDIKAEKIELIKRLLDTNNPQILESIKRILQKEKSTDIWDELTPDQQNDIREATSEIERGNKKDYEKFMSKHR